MGKMNVERFRVVLDLAYEAKRLGFRRLNDGTQLVGHVPHRASEAWFHIIFPNLDESDVTDLEVRALRRKIPKDYRDFLMECSNGLSLFSDSLALYGLRRNYVRSGDAIWQPFAIETSNIYERPQGANDTFFFVGSYNWDGSRLYLENGKAFRCARHSTKPLNEWSDFWEMLISEARRLSLLFDAQGREKDVSVPTTP